MKDRYVVEEEQAGTRLDKFLIAMRPDLSRSFVQGLIADGTVRVNAAARKANYIVKAGDAVHFEIPPATAGNVLPEEIPLDILYEDDALIVVNKPAGLVVHPAAGHATGTLVNAVLGHAPDLVTGNQERPGIVHRLDRDTSGVMLVAKTDAALHDLQRQFAAREIHKTYIALVSGPVKTPQGKIDAPLGRDPHNRKRMAIGGSDRRSQAATTREAVTFFRVIAQSDKYSLLRVEPETGRTHQIRVHLAWLKHPVVGDPVYGKGKNELGVTRQFLHAWSITFRHPSTNTEMTKTAPLPADLIQALEKIGIDAAEVLVK